MHEEHVSQRWADALLQCRAPGGNYEGEDIWLLTRDVFAGARRLEGLRQIQYHFKKAAHGCGCGNRHHEIREIEELPVMPLACEKDEVKEKDGSPDFPLATSGPAMVIGGKWIMREEKKD